MVRTVLVVVIVALIFVYSREANAQGRKRCLRKNEVWNDCGTACPLTCEYPEQRPCIKRCEAACQCREGFFRKSDRTCVRLEDC